LRWLKIKPASIFSHRWKLVFIMLLFPRDARNGVGAVGGLSLNRAGSWFFRALRLQSDCGSPLFFPFPSLSPPLITEGACGRYEPPQRVWGGAQPQTKFRAFWLKCDRFREFCGRIWMKCRIKTIIVTGNISFILHDFIGFRS